MSLDTTDLRDRIQTLTATTIQLGASLAQGFIDGVDLIILSAIEQQRTAAHQELRELEMKLLTNHIAKCRCPLILYKRILGLIAEFLPISEILSFWRVNRAIAFTFDVRLNPEAESFWGHITSQRLDFAGMPAFESWFSTFRARHMRIAENNRVATSDATIASQAPEVLSRQAPDDPTDKHLKLAKEQLERECMGGVTQILQKRREGSLLGYTRTYACVHKKKGKSLCPAGGRITEDGVVTDAVPHSACCERFSKRRGLTETQINVIRTTCNVLTTPRSAQASLSRHMTSKSDSTPVPTARSIRYEMNKTIHPTETNIVPSFASMDHLHAVLDSHYRQLFPSDESVPPRPTFIAAYEQWESVSKNHTVQNYLIVITSPHLIEICKRGE